jgi:hypothetical protein
MYYFNIIFVSIFVLNLPIIINPPHPTMVCEMYTRGQVSFLSRERGQRGGDKGGMRM